jgi:integrase
MPRPRRVQVEIVPPPGAGLVRADPETTLAPALAPLVDRVRAYQQKARAPSTIKAYGRRWKCFVRWCAEHRVAPVPADPFTVGAYLVERADERKSVSALEVDRAAIAKAHTIAGFPDPIHHPEVELAWEGIRRALGVRAEGKDALLTGDLERLVAAVPGGPGAGLADHRDRAILLLGFTGAFRRSELAALKVEDLAFVPGPPAHLRILLPRSKSDQAGKGRYKYVHEHGGASCPVAALRTWLQAAGIDKGTVFRAVHARGGLLERPLSGQMVWRIVKEYAAKAGLDAARFGAHSLRSGFVTTLANEGVPITQIMDQTGHADPKTALKYVKDHERAQHDLTGKLGLGKGG